MEPIDIFFWGFITFVVIGGVFCLLKFLPKEHEFDSEHADFYRIQYRDGAYSISKKPAKYGENIYSLRSKYFYVKKIPFAVDAFCDEAVGKDKKTYRANATVTVYFPEDKLQTFAPNFHNVSHESVEETLSEALSTAIEEAVKSYEGDKTFEDHFKEVGTEKLKTFGLIIMSINDLKVNRIDNKEE